MESKLRIRPKHILAAGLAAAAGVTLAVKVSQIPESSAQGVNVGYVEACLNRDARLANRHGLSAYVLNSRAFEVGAKVLDVYTTDPACDNAEAVRSTDVVIRQDGRVIGRLNNLINPQNDNGQKETGEVHTTALIGCGDTEKVTFVTEAQSYELPGTVTTSTQSFSFGTNCS
jgi:hypothetical protein